ncbi:hypothetical protein QAD02_000458 [Eretmocerus hayati]|uniref:Uncharacterized protein n=1 Tax=Eretmocerus hayati TaxID=131215 RepID=A0ACC2NFT0_9HYME|nr:hypothetical protein QAD02_000458 [Eretmocerus hayati]
MDYLEEARVYFLHTAIALGDADFVAAMLNDGHDPNIQDRDGQNSIMIAVVHQRSTIIDYLLDHGVFLNASNRVTNANVLSLAVQQDDISLFEKLLAHGARPGLGGNIALIESIVLGRSDMVKKLLKEGANVHHPDRNTRYPIDAAFYNLNNEDVPAQNKLEILDILLAAGAKLIDADTYPVIPASFFKVGANAVYLKMKENGMAVPEDYDLDENPLILSTDTDDESLCKNVLEMEKIGINSQDDRQETALHKAARRKCFPIVKMLVQMGADCDVVNNNGKSPLMMSIRRGEVKRSFSWLLPRSSQENIRNTLRYTCTRGVPIHTQYMTRFIVRRYNGRPDCQSDYFFHGMPDLAVLYYISAKSELEAMAHWKFGNSTQLSDLMVLDKKDTKVENRNLINYMSSRSLELEFPIFAKFARKRYRRAVVYRSLLNNARAQLGVALKIDSNRLFYIVREILTYLDEEDLLNLQQI